jgi:hypothetical protein
VSDGRKARAPIDLDAALGDWPRAPRDAQASEAEWKERAESLIARLGGSGPATSEDWLAAPLPPSDAESEKANLRRLLMGAVAMTAVAAAGIL